MPEPGDDSVPAPPPTQKKKEKVRSVRIVLVGRILAPIIGAIASVVPGLIAAAGVRFGAVAEARRQRRSRSCVRAARDASAQDNLPPNPSFDPMFEACAPPHAAQS